MANENIISENYYGVPTEGSEVKSMGNEIEVPDYVENVKDPNFLSLAAFAYKTGNRFLRGQEIDPEDVETLVKDAESKDVAKIAYNVVTGPSRLVTDSAQYLVDKFYPEKSENFEDLAIKMFGKSAEQIGTLTGYDKKDIMDSETGKAQPVESTTGLVLDIGTLFASGIGIYNLADKAKILQNTKLTKTGQKWVNRIIKGDLSFAGASQLFNNPDNTVANIVQDTEFAKKDTVFADIINYLATDKEDSEMKKRASLLVQDLTIGVTFSTALAAIGVSAKAAMNFAKQRFNKKITALTTGEQKTFTDEILVEMRKAVETVDELPVIIQEETSEGLKQITAQALGNKEIIKIAPTLLYRTKQRYLTTRGFNTPLMNDAYQMTRRNIRMRTNIAYNTTTKLEQNINSYINEYTPSTDLVIKGASPTVKNPLTNIIKALRVNFKNLKIPEDGKVDYLNKTFNFSTDLSKSVLESRALITNLSKEFLEVGDNDELIREVITSDLESYMNTSYKLYEQGSWTPPSKVVTAAQRHLEDIYIEENFYGVNRLDLSQEKLDEAAASAAIDIDKILNKDKEAFNSFLSNRQKINESILKGKQFISPEIRALMGEYDSPSQNVLTTASKLIDLIENTRFFNTVANLGAKRPRYPALWEEATNKARQGLKASLDFEELKLKYNMDIPEKQFVVFDNGSKVGEVLKKTKEGLYEVEFKDVTGGKKVVTKAAKDLEIVLDNKLLKAFTEFEYEKIASKRPFVQSGSFVNSEDTLYTKPTYLFKQNESPPKGFRTPIQNTGSVLDDGYFTTPEIAKSLEGMQETFLFSRLVHGSKAVQVWRRGKGLLQKNKTVNDPTTQVRNGIGGTQFMMGNGWYPFKNGKVSFDVVINQIKNLQNQDLNLMYNYWQKEGIANTSLAMGDIEALFKNSDGQTTEEFTVKLMQRIENVTNKMGLDISKKNEVGTKWYDGTAKKIDSVANDPLVLPQKIYAEVDNFFKFATWFSELDVLVKANPTRSLKANMDEASQIVRNNLPNYDLVPPGFKALKDTPLGNFVSFTPEIIRTSSHILERSFLEMGSKNPLTLKRGLARLSGYSLLAGAWLGAPYFVAQQTGVSEELSDAIQVITEAPWSQKHNKIVFRWGDKLYYLDPTYLNPYDYFQSVAHTVLADYHKGKFNGDTAQDLVYNAIVDTIGQSLRFAHEESIGLKFVRYLNHAYFNDDGTDPDGNSIFAKKSQRTVENVLADGLKYTLKTAGPGVISDAEDQYLASTKTPNRSTGEIKNPMLKIIEFFTGFSFKEINVDAMLQRKVSNYASQVNFKLPTVNAGYVNEEGRDKEFKKFFNDVVAQQATKLEADQELYRQLIAFEKIPTYGKLRISKVLKERGVNISQDTLNSIFEGKFKSKFPSPEKLEEAKKKIGNHEGFFYLEKYLEGINNTNLSPQVDLEFAGLTKDAITAIKSGKRIFESFYTGSYERIKNRINQSDFSGSKYFPPSREERATGGVVDVPNAPDEPDERIDKLTGLPYNEQAGEAYMDKEDPLRRLGFASGGGVDPLVRLGFSLGSLAKLGGKVIQALGKNKQTLMVKPKGDNAGFVDVATKENVTGEVFPDISISGLEGKKGIIVNDSISVPSKAQLALKNLQVEGKTGSMLSDETGKVLYNTGAMKGSEKVNKFVNKSGGEGTRYKANLYKRRLWDWDKDIAPEGMTSASNDSLIAITGKGSKHHFALNSNFKEGAKLSYFPDKKSPQYQTVTIGDMELGNIVGYMRPKSHPLKKDGTDNLHPVYDNITITTGRLKEFDGGKIKEFGGMLLNALKNIFKRESSTLAPLKNIDAVATKDPSDIQVKQQGGRFSADYDGKALEISKEMQAKIDRKFATEIVEANKNIPFINRMVDSNNPNYEKAITIKEGKETHRMANRGNFAYPTIFINPETNELEKLTEDAAFERAIQTGEFIEFDNDKQAAWFATNNYKKAQQVQDYFKSKEPKKVSVETFGTGDIRPEIKVNADDLTANMLNVFEYTLADSKNPRIMELTKEERKGYAKFLTAQALHESERFNEESGTFNYSGRKATQAQIKAGKARKVGTYEMVGGNRVDTREYFTDFSSLDDFATKQVNYLDRQFPKFFKAKTYDQAIAALFKGENNGVYATDMFKNVINFPDIKEDIIDTNPLTNQYSIKVANYLGHGNEGFLMPKPRPDMNIIRKKNAQGKYNEAWVTSPIGKKGTLTSRRGINNKQYINQDLYNELVPDEATIIGQEKER